MVGTCQRHRLQWECSIFNKNCISRGKWTRPVSTCCIISPSWLVPNTATVRHFLFATFSTSNFLPSSLSSSIGQLWILPVGVCSVVTFFWYPTRPKLLIYEMQHISNRLPASSQECGCKLNYLRMRIYTAETFCNVSGTISRRGLTAVKFHCKRFKHLLSSMWAALCKTVPPDWDSTSCSFSDAPLALFHDDSSWHVCPWGKCGRCRFKLCERSLDVVQGRRQIHRPEPWVRCFFLLLHM